MSLCAGASRKMAWMFLIIIWYYEGQTQPLALGLTFFAFRERVSLNALATEFV